MCSCIIKFCTNISFLILGGWKYDIDGVDYVYQNYTVKFYEGEKSKKLFINLVDDNIVESDETYNLTINGASLRDRVIVGEFDTATIVIANDDSKYICIHSYSNIHIKLCNF